MHRIGEPARQLITGAASHLTRAGRHLSKPVYFTNSLYGAWDDQFYPDGLGAWMAKLDVADGGGISFDERSSCTATTSAAVGRTRLQGGDDLKRLLLLPAGLEQERALRQSGRHALRTLEECE